MKALAKLCRCILALSLTVPPLALGQCSGPSTSPTHLVSSGSCGTTVWELAYSFKGTTVIQSSDYSPAGSCGGQYYDCNCEWVGSYQKPGSVSGVVIVNGSGWDVYWNATNYNVIYHDVPCSSSSLCCNNATDTAATTYTTYNIDQKFLTC